MDELRIIEAALFSAGHPLSIDELKENTEMKEKVIKDCLKKLIKEYKERDSVIEVAQVGVKYAMQLKPELAGHVQKIADMDIPLKVLKTAALIAYHQPVRQRDLFEMVGYRTYEHVKILHELGLIRRRDSGRTKIITTTERFSEYFGISTTDRDEIKKWMIDKLNLHVPEPRSKSSSEDEDNEEPGEALSDVEGEGEAEVEDASSHETGTDEGPGDDGEIKSAEDNSSAPQSS